MRVLCWIGIHAWQEIYRRLAWWDQRHDVYRVISQCKRCKRRWEWYDTGE